MPTSISDLIATSSAAISTATGVSLADYFSFGYALIKQALGAGFGFIVAFWPLELVITIIIIVVLLARRAKNVGGRA